MMFVALTIAGIPYSLETIAAWHNTPPYSVTIPFKIANLGVHPVSVNLVIKKEEGKESEKDN